MERLKSAHAAEHGWKPRDRRAARHGARAQRSQVLCQLSDWAWLPKRRTRIRRVACPAGPRPACRKHRPSHVEPGPRRCCRCCSFTQSEKHPQLIELQGLSGAGPPGRTLSEPPSLSCRHLRRRWHGPAVLQRSWLLVESVVGHVAEHGAEHGMRLAKGHWSPCALKSVWQVSESPNGLVLPRPHMKNE